MRVTREHEAAKITLTRTDLRRSLGSMSDRLVDWTQAHRTATIYGSVATFIAVWFVYAVIPGDGRALHNDMTEAYVWGREFQLGYNQHPPFWAWIAGIWFAVFPAANWSFYLLSVLNAAVGLVGAWWLIGLFAGGWTRRAATVLLLCTPFYTFKSNLYNANTIFLSLWPWTYYFFVRAMQTRRLGDSALFGAMVGLCLLSKYYTIVLLLSCFGASFAHPDWRHYYRSPSPWISGGVAAIMFLPHVVWALLSHAPPVEYALGLSGVGLLPAVGNELAFLVEIAAFHVVVVAIVLLSRRPGPGAAVDVVLPDHRMFLAALVVLPVVFTVLFGFVLELKIAGRMAVGIFPLLPLWILLAVPSVRARLAFEVAMCVVVVTSALALLAAPALAEYTFLRASNDPAWVMPQQELAQEATRLWHQQTHAPLRLVGGSKFIGNAVAFYSDDHPSGFVLLSFQQAPWVTMPILQRDGLLAVCLHDDADCLEAATRLMHADTTRQELSLKHTYNGHERAPVTIDVFITPPHPPG